MGLLFGILFQRDLDEVVALWNCHKIRRYRNQVAPAGRPMMMYSCPELFGKVDCSQEVDPQKLLLCQAECSRKARSPCLDNDIYELCCLILAETGLNAPEDPQQASELYIYLREYIHNEMQ